MDDLGVVDGRVILSSTGDTALTGDNLRTGSLYDSYTYMLFSRLGLGDSLGAAHTYAESAVLSATSYQYPLVEADADGIAGESVDYTYASNAYVAYGGSSNSEPVVSVAKGDSSYSTSSGSLQLWLQGYDLDGSVVSTTAQVKPPSGSGLSAETIALTYNDSTYRYEADTEYFTVGGIYTVSYYLVDDEGSASTPSVSYVLVTDDSAPEDPTNFGVYAETEGSITLSWTASTSTDATGYRVYQRFQYGSVYSLVKEVTENSLGIGGLNGGSQSASTPTKSSQKLRATP